MPGISDMLFSRKHFPIIERTELFRDFYNIRISVKYPPCHPSIRVAHSIDTELSSSKHVIDPALEATIFDLEEAAKELVGGPNGKKNYVRDVLDRVYSEGDTEADYTKIKKGEHEARIIEPFPLIRKFCITKHTLSTEEHGIENVLILTADTINPSVDIKVPEGVTFPKDLMELYGLRYVKTIRRFFFGPKMIRYTTNWGLSKFDEDRTRSINDIVAVFYKNFIIALNNAYVRREHGILKDHE